MIFHDTEGSEFLAVWDLSRSFQSKMIAPHVIWQPWESVSHPKKENLCDCRNVYQSSTGYDSGKRVLSMNLFINLSLVTIVLKHHYWKCIQNKYFGQNKWFLLGSTGSAGSAVPRSVVPQISDTPVNVWEKWRIWCLIYNKSQKTREYLWIKN